ncbi:Uncharacterised protein [Mycobacterium tuberculosis]|nr:Uncharacterised protein [Mycobacterium tuberculosis]
MVAAFLLPLLGFRPFQLGDPAASGAICFPTSLSVWR